MRQFDYANAEELAQLIFRSYAHDAKIVCADYDIDKKTFILKLFNEFFDQEINILIEEVLGVIFLQGNVDLSPYHVYSLSIDKEYNTSQVFCNDGFSAENNICLLLETFSGNALRIISKKITWGDKGPVLLSR